MHRLQMCSTRRRATDIIIKNNKDNNNLVKKSQHLNQIPLGSDEKIQ